jgi:hypothetical protein
VERQIQRLLPPLDVQLDVHPSALVRHRGLHLYWLARLLRALRRPGPHHLRRHGPGHGQSFYVAFYIIGVTAASFHLGNGLWNFACKWGIAVTVRSQRVAAYFGGAVGIALTFVGICIVIGLRYSWFPLGSYVQ